MQFEKDIFISYAHIDDESLVASQKGWITEFHRSLEIRLAQLLGRRPVIWRDPSLQGN
ncbi:MAG TPA: toll/interleukin-1 receptor domain-containing protein, partial [Chitinophagaceae bacterium]|nr:toll/interleukin-1 receptor domain-containing protein [Chitinophagaceae bacterium]